MNIWFTNEHEKTTNLNELNELRQREFVSVRTSSLFILSYQDTESTGAPSKARSRQLVKIQHEERLAATSELNPTPCLVTD